MSSGTEGDGAFWLLVGCGGVVFFLPSLIAFMRGHRYRYIILVLNLFGWTGLLWLGSFVWAVWPSNGVFADPVIGSATGIGVRNVGDALGEADFGRRRGFVSEANRHGFMQDGGGLREANFDFVQETLPAASPPRPEAFIDAASFVEGMRHDHQLSLLERLQALRDAGVLTQEEFEAKKADILRDL